MIISVEVHPKFSILSRCPRCCVKQYLLC